MRIPRIQPAFRRRAMALVMTVLVLAILLATAAQLATLSATRSVTVDRRVHALQHRLAADSAVALIAAALNDGQDISRTLDRHRQVRAAFSIGDCQVQVLVQDDGAKFNVLALADQRSLSLLRRRLGELGRVMRLPELEIDPQPIVEPKSQKGPSRASAPSRSRQAGSLVTFDQLFKHPPSPAIFHWDLDEADPRKPVWSDYVSLFGDGRMDLQRADRQIVELALRDIRPGLAIAGRAAGNAEDAWANVDAGVRPQVAARTGYGLDRYALTIQSTVGTDVQRWYVVATIKQGTATVLHRQQITW